MLQAACNKVYTWASMNNSTLLQENEEPINSPGFMAFSILLAVITLAASLMIGFTIVTLFKANAVPTPLPHQPSLCWASSGVDSNIHFNHLCCFCACELQSSQTTAPMQSLLVGICDRTGNTTLEPSRILTFHPGHCYLQQEDHQQVDCCSYCPYPVVGAHAPQSLHYASIGI